MRTNDHKPYEDKRVALRSAMQAALNQNDQDGFYKAFDQLLEVIAEDVKQQYKTQVEALQETIDTMQSTMDSQVLAARGVHQLTAEEKTYWQKFGEAAGADNPKQAIANLNLVMPRTVVNSVFDDLQQNHPLLSVIDFMPTGGAIQLMMNESDYQEAAWGALCTEIVKELTSGFKEVNATLFKLSAFLPVCKAMLELGPEWLDNYVRSVLYEAWANGLEAGAVSGDGNGKPIGMNRQVGDDVTVTGGVYPEKEAIPITDLYPETVGDLLARLAVGPKGKVRKVQNVVMIVNPVDYYRKLMPSTTVAGTDGGYRNDVLPYPMTLVQSPAIEEGKAILGLGKRYFAAAGASTKGKIEYSDEYHFLEDERVYIVKGYANGMPKDNNAFLVLDISGLKPTLLRAVLVDQAAMTVADESGDESGEG